MAKSPQQIVDKYTRGVSAAGPDYQAGVQNPKRSWSSSYKASQQRMINGFNAAAADGRMSRGVDRVGDQGWQAATLDKAARYTSAAQSAGQKYAERAADILAAGQAAQNAAAQIPSDTMENRLQRAVAAMTASHNYWRNKR